MERSDDEQSIGQQEDYEQLMKTDKQGQKKIAAFDINVNQLKNQFEDTMRKTAQDGQASSQEKYLKQIFNEVKVKCTDKERKLVELVENFTQIQQGLLTSEEKSQLSQKSSKLRSTLQSFQLNKEANATESQPDRLGQLQQKLDASIEEFNQIKQRTQQNLNQQSVLQHQQSELKKSKHVIQEQIVNHEKLLK